ncbi:metallophosphoesterase [Balneatrix alpica]|uniref:Metallophosphoesterase n=1 Tax=Balneatrix alpica TaxID=75684 RepID=A0ABV5Z954_9GAMM|nr:metallophosphoesterase [Balneatrix alpica]
MDAAGYDLIGDVHGCSHTLERLLRKMGYRKLRGVYRHPRRKAIFLGDIVDRGPRIREALHLVKEMVDAGQALMIMGNHEYNALCYCTPSRAESNQFLRAHNARHERIIRETLAQFALYPREWEAFLQWFMELPLFLEFDHFRVVHACWDESLIREFARQYPSHCMDADFLHQSAQAGSFAYLVADRLMRGTSMHLPNGSFMVSKDGFHRRVFRTSFWKENPQTYGDIVFQPDPLPEDIAAMPLTSAERKQLLYYGPEQRPLFIGHYWREGLPAPITANIACLDYSAVKYGKLVAYRMGNEARLHQSKFIWSEVRRPELLSQAYIGPV